MLNKTVTCSCMSELSESEKHRERPAPTTMDNVWHLSNHGEMNLHPSRETKLLVGPAALVTP
jgi:hypothetical protein